MGGVVMTSSVDVSVGIDTAWAVSMRGIQTV
jgi:hypothetical protein